MHVTAACRLSLRLEPRPGDENRCQQASSAGTPLMDLAEKVQAGGLTTEAAVAQARALIVEETAGS